jgi:putative ABC transport system permease protein
LVAFGGLVLVALCLLLIACANVANLLLVRATERVRALGIQTALGASRIQIGTQLFLESLILAAVGGSIGLLMADVAVSTVQRTLATEHFGYFWMRMAVDGTVLAFTASLVVGTALVAGILPVVRVLRADVQRVLKEEGAGSAVGGGGAWSNAFVTAQLALSCGALVAAGLTGRSLVTSRDFGSALPVQEVLLASVDPRKEGADGEFFSRAKELEASLDAMPGARFTALALGAPGYGEPFSRLEVQGSEVAGPEAQASTGWNAVTPEFFDAFDLPLRAGRALTSSDDGGAPRVAVVNETFVRRFSPEQDVLGRQVRLARVDSTSWFTVVGVVTDADMGAGERARNERVYVPLSQVETREVWIVARGSGDGALLTPELRRAVAAVDPAIPLWGVRTVADAHAYMMRIPRALASMAVAGGSAGLLVAMVGLYGLLSFRVRQRRRELGVRLALGADGATLVRSVLGLAARQLLPAVAVGLLLAWLASPVLAAFLLGLDPRAADTYATVALVFVGMGMLAALVPALRAGAVDPARVLRGE